MQASVMLLILFAAFAIFQRIVEMLAHPKHHGEKKAYRTTVAMTFMHIVCFGGALLEWWCRSSWTWNLTAAGGVLLFAAGFFLRRWLIRTLGSYWSVSIEIREDHPLITSGPFAFCRHPNYLAILLEVTGYCLVYRAWITLLFTLPAYGLVLLWRIRLEEREMILHFGEAYENYRKSTPVLIPCIRRNTETPDSL